MAGWTEVCGVAPGFPVGESSLSHDGVHTRGERCRWTPCTVGQPWGAVSQVADCARLPLGGEVSARGGTRPP